jgi:ubiquinone/menaquinone biosynthesis C-methylase UbiE
VRGDKRQSVAGRFEERAEFWRDLYDRADAVGAIYRRREEIAIEAIGRTARVAGPVRVLDLGCGAGRVSVVLASRGMRVHAVDSVLAMLALTRDASLDLPDDRRPVLTRADASQLPFADDAFDVVVSLGLLPWVDSPHRVVGEMDRVLRPGGIIVASWDNARRLSDLIDPLHLAPVRHAAGRIASSTRRVRGGRTPPAPRARRDSPEQVRRMLADAGLVLEWERTVGFAPFKLAGRVLQVPMVDRLSESLERRAENGTRWLGRRGNQILAQARKALL